MTVVDFQALSPLLVLSGGAVVLMLQIAFWRRVGVTAILTTLVLAFAAVSCIHAGQITPQQVTPLLLADRYALLFCVLFCVAAAGTARV
jgi:NADH-quinone oxidoreductase subunit N